MMTSHPKTKQINIFTILFTKFSLYYDISCLFNFIITRTLARYAHLVLAPVGGWGTVQTLLGANKYSCILISTISYPYITIITHNRSCYYSICCYKFAIFGYPKFIPYYCVLLSNLLTKSGDFCHRCHAPKLVIQESKFYP